MALNQQIGLDSRPAALDLVTRMMYPDGIFVRSLNACQALMLVRFPNPAYNASSNGVYPRILQVESANSPQVLIQNEEPYVWKEMFDWQRHLTWVFRVNLSSASLGKHPVRLAMRLREGIDPSYGAGVGYDYIGEIFVADATFDLATFTGRAFVPEGELAVKISKVQLFQEEKIKGKIPCDNRTLFLPKGFETTITFRTPFAGVNGPIPFNDPWWKVAGWIVAIVAGLIAGIWLLGGVLGWWNSPIQSIESVGTDPETGQPCTRCEPGQGTTVQGDPIWGFFVAAFAAGVTVGMADIIDPYRRGELLSNPNPGDRTRTEDLRYEMQYPHIPLPGTPFSVKVDWEFKRHGTTTPNYPAVARQDTVQNIHYLTQYVVRTADGRTDYVREDTRTIAIEVDLRHTVDYARFKKEIAEGERVREPLFYVFGYLRHRNSKVLKSAIFAPNYRGVFVGSYPIARDDHLGEWDFMAVIQNINNSDVEAEATERAKIVGAFVYSKNFEITHNSSTGTCSVDPKWDLTIRLTQGESRN